MAFPILLRSGFGGALVTRLGRDQQYRIVWAMLLKWALTMVPG
jgi:hypothetical protein